MIFVKKAKEKISKVVWKGISFSVFSLQLPLEWVFKIEDGRMKAKFNDEIRLTISGYSIEEKKFINTHKILEGIVNGYKKVGFVKDKMFDKTKAYIGQEMQLDGIPCCYIASTANRFKGDRVILNFAFHTEDEITLARYKPYIAHILGDIKMLTT